MHGEHQDFDCPPHYLGCGASLHGQRVASLAHARPGGALVVQLLAHQRPPNGREHEVERRGSERASDTDEGSSGTAARSEPPRRAFEDHELTDEDAEGEPDDGDAWCTEDEDAEGEPDDGEAYCTEDEDAEGEDDDGDYEAVGCI